jgi:hypothetical protein
MREADRQQRPVFEDMHFQELSWTLQRAGWVVIALIVALALTGVFSHGFFSSAVARQNGFPLTVNYERFQRLTASYRFDIFMPPSGEDEIRLTFNKTFSDFYEIDSIQPQPLRSNSINGGFVLAFEAADRSGFYAVVWARPRSFGYAPLEIGTPQGALTLPVLVYP